MFKRKNLLKKLWLKYTNYTLYKEYKWELSRHKQLHFINSLNGTDRVKDIFKINEIVQNENHLNINHSGNAGDIIYALPTLKKIYELTNCPINLYLSLNQPLIMTGFRSHPLGNVMLNEKMAQSLIPLIQKQPYINNCKIYTEEKIHINLDFFRSGLIPVKNTNIARWCGYITGTTPELYKKWLDVIPDKSYNDKVIFARSERYNNESIDYSFLAKYSNIYFVGVKSEYEKIKKILPDIQWIQVLDFVELAQIIAGCKFFIGNQSFPFSIAEALKVPRILEVYSETANVIPEGQHAYDFLFQEHLEWLVFHLNRTN